MRRAGIYAAAISLMLMAGCSKEGVNPCFQGTVLKVGERTVLVEPLEGEEERKSADQIQVSTDVISTNEVPKMEEGTLIRVVYNGEIAESYPAQINQVFAIYLIDESGETVSPTGYPSDEAQRITVYYQGTRYWYMGDGFDQPLPDGFEKVGEIEEVDNTVYRDEELCGTQVEVGQEVYANAKDTSRVFLKYPDGYAAFEKENIVQSEE